ncbi:MAG TPA: LysM peptidoglycan-binding domain-containing protein [Myxococcales bacterium]
MVRSLTAAVLAILLLPGASWAQEAEKAEKAEAGPAVTEPEQQSAEVAPGKAGPKAGGQESVYESYTVKPGDTLWDLSSRFLGNPWYWPKVWSYNPEIENPHWIYPGNQIRFYPSGEEGPAQVEGEGVKAPQEIADVSEGNLNAPEQFGEDEDPVAISGGQLLGYKSPKKSIMRQDGLVTQRELDDAGVIENAYTTKEMLDNYERVYLKFRNQSAVRIGERYSIFRTIDAVAHPVNGSNYGYLTKITGTLRVIATDKNYVTGLIDQTFEPIMRGDFVGPLGNFDKQIIRKENTREVKGVILLSLNRNIPALGEQHWAFIDKGSKDGVEEGNTFTVYKRGDPLLTEDVDPAKLPAEIAGTLLVVDVKEHASEALIVRSLLELGEGDQVIMKPMASQAAAQ